MAKTPPISETTRFLGTAGPVALPPLSGLAVAKGLASVKGLYRGSMGASSE